VNLGFSGGRRTSHQAVCGQPRADAVEVFAMSRAGSCGSTRSRVMGRKLTTCHCLASLLARRYANASDSQARALSWCRGATPKRSTPRQFALAPHGCRLAGKHGQQPSRRRRHHQEANHGSHSNIPVITQLGGNIHPAAFPLRHIASLRHGTPRRCGHVCAPRA
jgi:hypothetical protein